MSGKLYLASNRLGRSECRSGCVVFQTSVNYRFRKSGKRDSHLNLLIFALHIR